MSKDQMKVEKEQMKQIHGGGENDQCCVKAPVNQPQKPACCCTPESRKKAGC
ncbi:MAG: hypothetical protein GY765_41130 [bacterium]|nr:hypothetical protein [bacterium]